MVETITRHAYRVTDEELDGLRAHGWTEPQIAEMVYDTALFAFFNRVADAFGIDTEGYGGPRPNWGDGPESDHTRPRLSHDTPRHSIYEP